MNIMQPQQNFKLINFDWKYLFKIFILKLVKYLANIEIFVCMFIVKILEFW